MEEYARLGLVRIQQALELVGAYFTLERKGLVKRFFAALELRRRLRELVGDEARGVTVQTFHGLAIRLTGHAPGGEVDFEAIMTEAVALLRGERELMGLEADELRLPRPAPVPIGTFRPVAG